MHHALARSANGSHTAIVHRHDPTRVCLWPSRATASAAVYTVRGWERPRELKSVRLAPGFNEGV